MEYMKVKNNKVVEILCGPSVPKGMIELPKRHQLRAGDNVQFFKDGKRVAPEESGITAGENQSVVWTGHEYKALDDYREKKFWDTKTGKPVKMKLGQKPDNTVTEKEKTDPAAKWKDGEWIVPDEVKAERIRAERNSLLAGTDYLLMPDYPLKEQDRKTWEDYRQSLRDVPQQAGFPDTIEWPEVPR